MVTTKLIKEDLTHSVIGAFYETYNTLGYGFLESVYAAGLDRELATRGHRVSREHAVPVTYKGVEIAFQRVDMLVDEVLVVEIKATPILAANASRQLLSYLRGTRLEVGLLLHFGPEAKFYRVVHSNRVATRSAESAPSAVIGVQR